MRFIPLISVNPNNFFNLFTFNVMERSDHLHYSNYNDNHSFEQLTSPPSKQKTSCNVATFAFPCQKT